MTRIKTSKSSRKSKMAATKRRREASSRRSLRVQLLHPLRLAVRQQAPQLRRRKSELVKQLVGNDTTKKARAF